MTTPYPLLVTGLLMERPITHLRHIANAMEAGFGIEIPLLFGGEKKKIFRNFCHAVYCVSTEALLFDTARLLRLETKVDTEPLELATVEVFEGLANRSPYPFVKALCVGVHGTYALTMVRDADDDDTSETTDIDFPCSVALIDDLVPSCLSHISILGARSSPVENRYNRPMRALLCEELQRVYLGTIMEVQRRSGFAIPPDVIGTLTGYASLFTLRCARRY